jgi:hypothetical protein
MHFANEGIHAYHRALERSVITTADLVLFTCEEMRHFVLENYGDQAPKQTGILPHAFVPQWYDRSAAIDGGGFRFLHTGSFYGPRTPAPLLDALLRLRATQQLAGKLRFDCYGGMDATHRQRIASEGLQEIVGVHGFIPYLDSLALMRSHEALLLIDAPLASTAESVFLPSKLIDYLGAGVPIVAVTPERGATARVVRETGGIVCALERPQELDALLEAILAGGRLNWRPQAAEVERYSHHAVARNLRAEMERIAARRS